MCVNHLNPLIGIKGWFHSMFVIIKWYSRDIAIIGVNMDDNMWFGNVGLTSVSSFIVTGVHVTHSANEDLLKCFVSYLILLPN